MEFLSNPSVIGFIVFLALLLLNMPIFASLGLAALFTIVVFNAAPLAVVPYILGGSLDKFPLLATPLFIIAGTKLGLLNIVLATAIHLFQGELSTSKLIWDWAFAFMGGVAAGIVTAGLVPLIEIAFDYTTDITLLELAQLQ